MHDFRRSGEYNTDPKYVRSGERSARWYAAPYADQLPVLRLGAIDVKAFAGYRYLSLSQVTTVELMVQAHSQEKLLFLDDIRLEN